MFTEAPPQAFYELYFLLARGYPRTHALELVATRHQLTRRQRVLLNRCTHPPSINKETKKKLKPLDKAKRLVIDTYNQLATIYAALTGNPVYRCTDHATRDSLLGASRQVTKHAKQLAAIATATLAAHHVEEAVFIVDAQPSHSAHLAAALREAAAIHGVNAETRLEHTADKAIIQLANKGYTAATSDTVILQKIPEATDLAAAAITLTGLQRAVTDIPRLLEEQHTRWCQGGPVA